MSQDFIEDEEFYVNFDDSKENEIDVFNDDNISDTLKKYNYDYKFLLRELTSFIDYSDLMELLASHKISKNEYLNPTYEIFDILRKEILKK